MQPSSGPTPPMITSNDDKNKKGGFDKKKLLILGAAAVVVIIGVGAALYFLWPRSNSSSANGQDAAVAISEKVANITVDQTGYTPASITIKKGQQITWTNNNSSPRRLTADQTVLEGFNTDDPLNQGDTYTYIFTQSGSYRYYDPDDAKTYVGTIEVKD